MQAPLLQARMLGDKVSSYKYIIAAVLIIIAIIVIYYIATINRGTYQEYISGLWVADPKFCERAEISSMMFYIGEKCSTQAGWRGDTRNSYIIVIDEDGETIVNQGAIITLGRGWAGPKLSSYGVSASVLFDDERLWADDSSSDDSDDESSLDDVDIKPVKVKLTFDMPTGVLRITRDDKLLARLHKTPI